MIQHVRIARPSSRFTEVAAFYRALFDFETLGTFTDHDGFDGIMLGRPEYAFHLELTRERHGPPIPAASEEDLTVFYFDEAAFRAIEARLRECGVERVPSHNPYWDSHGITVADPDGRRIVLHRGRWIASTPGDAVAARGAAESE